MPRILIINTATSQGSVGSLACNIGLAASREGWEVAFAHSSRYSATLPTQFVDVRIGSLVSEYVHAGISRIFDAHGLGSRAATDQLINEIKKFAPNVIHIHNIHGYYLNYELLFDFLKSAGIPTVWTLHDCWPLTGHCAHFLPYDCTKWNECCHHCPAIGDYPAAWTDNSTANFHRKIAAFTCFEQLHIITVSRWLESVVRRSFLKNYPVATIHNGIDLTVFHPVATSFDCDSPIILAVATSLGKSKGLEDLIILRNLLPSHFRIRVIGNIDSDSKKRLDRVGVEYIGYISDSRELARYYSEASVFVNPTHADSFPTTNLEAMACGTPVVSYNVGGACEMLSPNTGIAVPSGDVEALAKAVIDIIDVGKETFASACRTHIQQTFDIANCTNGYLNLYNSIITEN